MIKLRFLSPGLCRRSLSFRPIFTASDQFVLIKKLISFVWIFRNDQKTRCFTKPGFHLSRRIVYNWFFPPFDFLFVATSIRVCVCYSSGSCVAIEKVLNQLENFVDQLLSLRCLQRDELCGDLTPFPGRKSIVIVIIG